MQTTALVLMTAAFVLGSGMAASAQQNPGTPTDQPQKQQPRIDQDRPGMMGGGMSRGGMMEGMGRGEMRHGMMGHGSMMGHRGRTPPLMLRMIFILVDTNSDGTISLQEFQAAHERIFKTIDNNKDGNLTLEEMQAFMRGSPATPQQH